jgi:hypothetical protein
LREPRSATTNPASVGAIVQWRRDTAESASTTSHAASAPTTTPIGGIAISTISTPTPAITRSRQRRPLAGACS